jgi:3-oxoacyl-[acyl-carrier-protein] synthase III
VVAAGPCTVVTQTEKGRLMSFLTGGNIQIAATSTCFPPQFKVIDIAQIDDPESYTGWEHVCVCEADLHPSEMAATALRTALSEAERSPADLDFILSVGTFADYPFPWSLATEVVGLLGCSKTCVGIDLNAGCAGLLVAMSALSGWLGKGTQGLAAIVCADRNSSFIERTGASSQLAGFSDTASALIVAAADSTSAPLGTFCGAEMLSHPSFNNLKTRDAGGTRFPQSDRGGMLGLNPAHPPVETAMAFLERLKEAIEGLRARTDLNEIDHLVATQISPSFLNMLRRQLRLRDDQVCVTGHDYGHSGSDLIIGLDALNRSGELHGNTLVLAAADYLFAAGLVRSDNAESSRTT